MSWDDLHDDDNDSTEYYDVTQKPQNVAPRFDFVSDEESKMVKNMSEVVNKGLRDLEAIEEEEEEESKWSKYKM